MRNVITSLCIALAIVLIIVLGHPSCAQADGFEDSRHFYVSAAGTFGCIALLPYNKPWEYAACAATVFAAGLAKEIYDHNTGGRANGDDIWQNAAGVTVGMTAAIVLEF